MIIKMTKKVMLQFVAVLLLCYSCSNEATEHPEKEDYKLGEKWVWKWSRAVDGEVRASGQDIQEVVQYKGDLGIWNGMDTIPIATFLDVKPGETPFRDWPLFVGKKWKYESEWENNEGTKGKTSQNVEVVAFEEVQVDAGSFMAYKIAYSGLVTNSRGFKGEMIDTWYYAPELKTYVKHINKDGYGIYTNELISYKKGQ